MPAESDPPPALPAPPAPGSLRDRLAAWAESLDLSLPRLLVGSAVLVILGIVGWRLLAPPAAPAEMHLPMVETQDQAGSGPGGSAPEGSAPEGAPSGDGDAAEGAAPGPDGAAAASPAASAGNTGGAAAPAPAERVVVHVAGAVHEPGVQRLPATDRVVDAVEASGGATDDADLEQINLAAGLQDGQQVYVPEIGEAAAPPPTGGTVGVADGAGDGTGSPVDVNAAGPAELEELTGVGPAIAQAIIDHRTSNGPFTSVDQLTDVRGIGDAKLEGLRDQATV